jgi:hypothetical protein
MGRSSAAPLRRDSRRAAVRNGDKTQGLRSFVAGGAPQDDKTFLLLAKTQGSRGSGVKPLLRRDVMLLEHGLGGAGHLRGRL